ncbi:hypothetical protein AC579_7591 [Pseudocercospora musae]|uniref:Uncharacterized protein n=1 Tax=Pseudocercospora musae TaxID=113226 RepID=A0A139H3K2_9PEZI|nr:hypothetical protein AC579_7591 [Pseudocercospora musae]
MARTRSPHKSSAYRPSPCGDTGSDAAVSTALDNLQRSLDRHEIESAEVLKRFRELWKAFADDSGTSSRLEKTISTQLRRRLERHILELLDMRPKSSKRKAATNLRHQPWGLSLLTMYAIFGDEIFQYRFTDILRLLSLLQKKCDNANVSLSFHDALGSLMRSRQGRKETDNHAVRIRNRDVGQEWHPQDAKQALQSFSSCGWVVNKDTKSSGSKRRTWASSSKEARDESLEQAGPTSEHRKDSRSASHARPSGSSKRTSASRSKETHDESLEQDKSSSEDTRSDLAGSEDGDDGGRPGTGGGDNDSIEEVFGGGGGGDEDDGTASPDMERGRHGEDHEASAEDDVDASFTISGLDAGFDDTQFGPDESRLSQICAHHRFRFPASALPHEGEGGGDSCTPPRNEAVAAATGATQFASRPASARAPTTTPNATTTTRPCPSAAAGDDYGRDNDDDCATSIGDQHPPTIVMTEPAAKKQRVGRSHTPTHTPTSPIRDATATIAALQSTLSLFRIRHVAPTTRADSQPTTNTQHEFQRERFCNGTLTKTTAYLDLTEPATGWAVSSRPSNNEPMHFVIAYFGSEEENTDMRTKLTEMEQAEPAPVIADVPMSLSMSESIASTVAAILLPYFLESSPLQPPTSSAHVAAWHRLVSVCQEPLATPSSPVVPRPRTALPVSLDTPLQLLDSSPLVEQIIDADKARLKAHVAHVNATEIARTENDRIRNMLSMAMKTEPSENPELAILKQDLATVQSASARKHIEELINRVRKDAQDEQQELRERMAIVRQVLNADKTSYTDQLRTLRADVDRYRSAYTHAAIAISEELRAAVDEQDDA